MQIRLLHAILSGAILAFVLGFILVPEIWNLINRERTFEPITIDVAAIGIAASVVITAITLISFKLVRRIEE